MNYSTISAVFIQGIDHQIVVVNNTYNGNDLHDLETIVTIWKALGMFKK